MKQSQKRQRSRMLPNSRFLGGICTKCNNRYYIDLGGSDRHEYLLILSSRKTTCPLCNNKMKTPEKFTYYGFVSN